MPKITPLDSAATTPANGDTLQRSLTRVMVRLAPWLMLMYVVSFLDRANVSFAKQALAATEGITESAYAMGAGLFFIGYSSCGFPSNLILHRIGAKIWIAFLMVTWGLVSMATMFVSGSTSFYVLRLLLGATEAGFFPGIILYLTYWFPRRVRGQMLGLFYLGVPLALIVGGPLSGWLLETALPGKLQGWQIMFLVEGALAAVLGVFAYWFLSNRPVDAKWLPDDEKKALLAELSREEAARRAAGPAKLVAMLRDGRVFGFFAVYALIQMSTYGAVFYLPAEISGLLHQPEGFEVGAVSAIPWLCALAATYILPRLGDKFQNHRLLAILTLLIAGAASFAFPACGPLWGLVMLSIAVSGFIAVQPLFWTFPTAYFADRAAAGGIALIGVGNLGGFLAPNVKVWADARFHSASAGLYVLAGLTVLNAGFMAWQTRRRT